MKAKLKDKRLLLTAVFFCALAAMFLWPTEVKAAAAGDFTVTGDTSGYSFSNGVLTVNSGANLTIKNTNPGTATDNTIVVTGNASITLSGVNIDTLSGSALSIQDSASVNLMLVNANTLHGREASYGVGLNLASSAEVIIDGEGSLLCVSGNGSAAAVNGGTVMVNGGTVVASAGPWSTGIQVGTLNIKGGTVQADGRGNPGIKGGTVNVSGGTLTANGGGSGAGINSDVTISGGTVTATGGGEGGAGIGGNGNGTGGAGIGGGNNGAVGTVNISGGTVIAKGGLHAAGIGGGQAGNGGDVVITGGSVKAENGGLASDIGGGQSSSSSGTLKDSSSNNVTLKTFTLQDNSGNSVNDAAIDDFTIPTYGIKDVRTDTEGKLYFYLPDSITDNTPVTVTAGGTDYVGKVNSSATLKPFVGDIDLSQGGNLYIWNDGYMRGDSADENAKKTYTGDYTLTGGTAESATANTVNVMGDYNGNPAGGTKKTITLNGVNIAASGCAFSIQANADVNLMLSGANTLKSGSTSYAAGLGVPEGASVTIDSAPATGSLTATGGQYGAGIGGGTGAAGGTVTINGGTVNATAVISLPSSSGGAGIGSGSITWGSKDNAGGDITINGGSVTATGAGGAAGIGGGYARAGGAVTITGGSVVAKGDNNGAGIGTGDQYKGSDFGSVTISGGTVTATGSEYAAGIGGGYQVSGEDVKITGGSVKAAGGSGAEAIGHGYIGSGTLGSGTLTDGSGNNVYLNTLTVGENGQSPEIAVESEVTIDGATNYGTKDVTTMDGGKLYFYLPNNTTNPEIAVTHDGTAYSRNYQRNRASRSDTYTATLLPPPSYTITIPEKVDFDTPAYQPAGSGQYNDKTFTVTTANLTNLTDGRSLSVMVSGSGTDGAFVMKTEGGGELPYSVYKDSAASGNQVQPGQALSAGWVNGSTTVQSGTLRLDQSQIKYSGRYTGTLTFTVNVVDSK